MVLNFESYIYGFEMWFFFEKLIMGFLIHEIWTYILPLSLCDFGQTTNMF